MSEAWEQRGRGERERWRTGGSPNPLSSLPWTEMERRTPGLLRSHCAHCPACPPRLGAERSLGRAKAHLNVVPLVCSSLRCFPQALLWMRLGENAFEGELPILSVFQFGSSELAPAFRSSAVTRVQQPKFALPSCALGAHVAPVCSHRRSGRGRGAAGAAALRGPRGGPPPPLPARGRCRRVPDRPPRCGSRGAAPVRAALCGGCGAALRPIRELRAGASCRGLCWGSSLGAAVALLLCHSSPRAKSVTEALSPAVATDLRARPAGGKGVFCQLGPLLPYSCDALLVPGSPSALQCFKMLPSGPCRQPTPGRSGHCRHEGDAARGDAPGEAAPPCRGG